MPSYDPFCQLKLAADAYASRDASPPVIHYLGFWSSFYQLAPGQTENSLQCMFRALLTGHNHTPIYIVSVFESPTYYSTTLPQLRRNAPPDALWVGFSGEPRELPWDWFHLNIIMKPENLVCRTVSLPNFVSNVYEMGLWPYLQQPRPVRYCPEKQKFCAFVVQNGGNGVRNDFTRLLSKSYKTVDCAGSWMNNMPNGATAPVDARVYGDRYLVFLQAYKFVICFENCAQPANLTEKILNAWMSGAIPIYWGCPNVLQWLNPRAFLYLEDGSQAAMKRLIERIRDLDTDPEQYAAMWNEPLIDPTKGIPKEWTLPYLRDTIHSILSTSNDIK